MFHFGVVYSIEIMKVLKFYQYEKIEFLFEEIKNELGHDLSKAIMICQKRKTYILVRVF